MAPENQKFPNSGKPLFYRPSDLAKTLGLGRSTVYEWEKQGRFPKRVNLAENVSGWLASDVEAWLAQKAEASK